MKRKCVTLQHQKYNQTNLMTQQTEIHREMKLDIQQHFDSYECKKVGAKMVVSN